MEVALNRGDVVSLTKLVPSLSLLHIGISWNAKNDKDPTVDIDACAFLLGPDRKLRSNSDFVFFNNCTSSDGSVAIRGNWSSLGQVDIEIFDIYIDRLSVDVDHIVFALSIFEAGKRHQNFKMVQPAFIRVVDRTDGAELARFDLPDDASVETTIVFGEIYRGNIEPGEFKFKACCAGADGLQELALSMGANV